MNIFILTARTIGNIAIFTEDIHFTSIFLLLK